MSTPTEAVRLRRPIVELIGLGDAADLPVPHVLAREIAGTAGTAFPRRAGVARVGLTVSDTGSVPAFGPCATPSAGLRSRH